VGRVVVDEFEGGGGEPRRKAGGAGKERKGEKEREPKVSFQAHERTLSRVNKGSRR